MNKQGVHTRCGPAGARRSWIAAGLMAGSLLLAGCGSTEDLTPSAGGSKSGGGGTEAGGGGTGGEGTVDHSAVIRGLKVCDMIDLEPLTTTLRSEYVGVPKDTEPGRGLDPDGPNCTAKLIGDDDSAPTYLGLGTIDVSVLPYPSDGQARSSYDTRIAVQNHMDPDASTVPLDGDWDQGTLVSGERTLVTKRPYLHSSAYALVRTDSYLVKVSVEISTTGKEPESMSVVREPLRPLVLDLVTSLYDAVNTELNE